MLNPAVRIQPDRKDQPNLRKLARALLLLVEQQESKQPATRKGGAKEPAS